MVLEQLAQHGWRGLLQHALQLRGPLPRGDKHAVVLGNLGAQPQPVAHHVGLGDGLQGLCGADIDVAAHHHGVQPGRCSRHDSLVERQLQLQQVLRKPLSALPAEHGQGGENLARGGIGRQSAALPAGVDEDVLFLWQPVEDPLQVARLQPALGRRASGQGLEQQPGGAAAGAQFAAHGVVGAEPFGRVTVGDVMKTFYEIGGKREQFLHAWGL